VPNTDNSVNSRSGETRENSFLFLKKKRKKEKKKKKRKKRIISLMDVVVRCVAMIAALAN
jgi:hypothetical protein